MTLPATRSPRRARIRALTTAAAFALSAMLLAGCGGGGSPAATSSDDPTAGVSPTPTQASPTPSPTASDVTATCEGIVVPDVLQNLTSLGWTYRETPFEAGGVSLDDGLQCAWADYSVASGNLLIFGWAPITGAQADAMQQGLEAAGWIRLTEGSTVYITEDPDQAPTLDADGYGMTYEFGDGWVTVADVKQGLLLIQRPQS